MPNNLEVANGFWLEEVAELADGWELRARWDEVLSGVWDWEVDSAKVSLEEKEGPDMIGEPYQVGVGNTCTVDSGHLSSNLMM